MPVGFLVDCFYYEVGNADFLHSFFSTVSHNLEKDGWGTRFPYMLNHLYWDKLNWVDVPKGIAELRVIEEELSKLSPEKVVWDIDDLSKSPPWGNNVSPKVTNLANYFATSEGRTFIELLFTALDVAMQEKHDLVIRKL